MDTNTAQHQTGAIEDQLSQAPLIDPRGVYNETEAAAIFRVTVYAIRKWRWSGAGPKFSRVGGSQKGRIRYQGRDLLTYLEDTRLANTAGGR